MSKETSLFVNREISWLQFNERVLEEAEDQRLPLCERLRFISIYGSNLDEFFMIRVGALFDGMLLSKNNKALGIDDKTGMDTQEQLSAVNMMVRALAFRLGCAYRDVMLQLQEEGIRQVDCLQMDEYEEKIVSAYFQDEVSPLLSPQIVDKQHPFPFFGNKELYIGLQLATNDDAVKLGIIPLNTSNLKRFFIFPEQNGQGMRFALLEDIVMRYAETLFKKNKIAQKFVLRITRNGDIRPDEALYDQDIDWRDQMERLLKKRKKAIAVRMQLSKSVSPAVQSYLCKRLDITEREVVVENAPLDLGFIYPLTGPLERNYPSLFYHPLPPLMPAWFTPGESMIRKVAKEGDLLLSYPYHSIKPFLDLLDEAAVDHAVVSIKITLYRVAAGSKVVSALIKAAENGKDVLVVVELRARFDEQNNIEWSKQLEEAGCTVIYGVDKYKVHSKLLVITRRVADKLSYITQIGTGNYNEKTSRIYSDLSLLTSNDAIALEGLRVFQALSMGQFVDSSDHLLVAPLQLKSRFMALIDQEIAAVQQGGEGYVAIKVNSISDKEIIQKLSEASQAGVKIDMLVRGICCFKAGVPGHTEHITVKSIVGRFLEHARIFVFGQGERQKIYIGSSDWMTRNTQYRVEVAVEVLDEKVKEEILYVLSIQAQDNIKARLMGPDGVYRQLFPKDGQPPIDSQLALYDHYAQQRTQQERQEIVAEEVPEVTHTPGFWQRLKGIFQKG